MELTLPYVSLQADYAQAYADVLQSLHDFEKVWLSAYSMNAPGASIHTSLLLSSKNNAQVEVEVGENARDMLTVRPVSENSKDLYIASSSSNGGNNNPRKTDSSVLVDPVIMRIPKRTMGPLVRGKLGVTAFDLADKRYVVGGSDGQAHVGYLDGAMDVGGMETGEAVETSDIENLALSRMRKREGELEAQRKTALKGHVGDIRSAKFFPSGQVILTTSSDCTARVYGIDGANPRTLTGHRRGVTSSIMIDKGREVVTTSSDGTSRLWDVGEGVQQRVFPSHKFSGVNSITVGSKGDSSSSFLTGLSSGVIESHDLRSGQPLFRITPSLFPSGEAPQASDRWEQTMSGSVEAVAWRRDSHVVVAGCSNGVTVTHDDRMCSSLSSDISGSSPARSMVATWRRNGASINDVQLLDDGRAAVVSTADGAAYKVDLHEAPRVIEEYNGWDVDNVQAGRFDSKGRIWLAGADGMLRMY